MADEQETRCTLAAILALRAPQDHSGETTRNKRKEPRTKRLLPSSNKDTARARIKRTRRKIALPLAIIRDGILSYRPFRSFKVVLIRGNPQHETSYGSSVRSFGSLRSFQRDYALVFGSNRGPLRFLVSELPYLPPRVEKDAEIYRSADGFVVSCYMSRFFEFCDRYGYDYASANILQDVQSRRKRAEEQQQQRESVGNNNSQNRINNNNYYSTKNHSRSGSVVLCGNNVDVTHAGARLSTIVFREHATEAINRSSSNNPLESENATEAQVGRGYPSPNSFIEAPMHPFSSLARSLTGDDGLEFHDVSSAGPGSSSSSSNTREESPRTVPLSGSHLAQNSIAIPDETKPPWSNDDDPRNWNWLRAQVSSSSAASSAASSA